RGDLARRRRGERLPRLGELVQEGARRRQALVALLLHHLREERSERRRHRGQLLLEVREGLVDLLPEDRPRVRAVEGRLAGEEVVERRAERVDVGAAV